MKDTKKKILVVDDIEVNRLILKELFKEEYEVLEAENGFFALKLIDLYKTDIAVILLDLVMPVVDGFGVLREMKQTGLIKSIPVILITGENDDEKALLGYGLGVSDLVHKPFNSDIVLRRVQNVIDLYSYKNHLEQRLDEQMDELKNQEKRIKQFNMFLIDALSTTVEFRNFESGEHIKRMRGLTGRLLAESRRYYPLSNEEIETISSASALHDIGKIAISDVILLKPGPLTVAEFDVMKTHTTKGCDILDSLNYFHDREYYKYCYEICRFHHERWDGRGYPDGRQKDEIPIWAQAASLADVYDALTSKRVYKAAYTHAEAVKMITDGECGVFNPVIMDSFLGIADSLNRPDSEEKKLLIE